jgi:hypothetical protein
MLFHLTDSLVKWNRALYMLPKVILDGETWVVNNSDDEDEIKSKVIGFIKKFKLPVKVSKVERFIDEYESKDLYELTYEQCKDLRKMT